MRYSQNGMDNSGHASNIEWSLESTSSSSSSSSSSSGSNGASAIALPENLASAKVSRYRHWQIQSGGWIGDYNTQTKTYEKINMTNIIHGLTVVRTVVQRYKNNTVVVGLEPVNEPWWETPIPWLKYFYWESYQIVQAEAPHWVTLLHDSFRFYLQNWGMFMVNCPNYALDVHLYQARAMLSHSLITHPFITHPLITHPLITPTLMTYHLITHPLITHPLTTHPLTIPTLISHPLMTYQAWSPPLEGTSYHNTHSHITPSHNTPSHDLPGLVTPLRRDILSSLRV